MTVLAIYLNIYTYLNDFFLNMYFINLAQYLEIIQKLQSEKCNLNSFSEYQGHKKSNIFWEIEKSEAEHCELAWQTERVCFYHIFILA